MSIYKKGGFMKRNFKKFFSILLLAVFIFTGSQSFAVKLPYTIRENIKRDTLAPGVEYENIKRFTSAGWWNINLVRVDMTNENNEIKGLISDKGVSHRETVNNLVDQNQGVVAGINGDFFEYGPIPHPTGGLIQDGEIITSPVEAAYAWPSFVIDSSNKAETLIMDRTMMAKNLSKNKETRITMVNKIKTVKSTPNLSAVYTHRWGKTSPGNTISKYVKEIVVDKGVVSEIRDNKGPVSLNKDRYIIHLRGNYRSQANHFKVGDKVSLSVDSKPDIENIKFMISGGSQILKNGKPMASHVNIKGNHPRTAIGISKDGNELVLATIDGRDSKYKGVSQEMFGAILKDFGMYNAINLDGGGSTTMAIKKPDDKKAQIVNIPSDKYPRKVSNGVGVKVNKPRGELTSIKLEITDTNIFKNTERNIFVKGYDAYRDEVKIDPKKLVLQVEGLKGEFQGQNFIPKEAGKGKIKVKYGTFEDSSPIRVLDKPVKLEFPRNKFSMLSKDKYYINPVYGQDANGFKALIYPKDIEFSVTNELGEFKDGWFYSKDVKGVGVITGKFGDASDNISVAVGGNDIPVKDFGNFKNLNFSSYPEDIAGSISLSDEVKVNKNSINLSYKFEKSKDNRAAYLNLNKDKGLMLTDNVNKIGFWVKGDGNKAWLRGTIIDIYNQEHSLDFKKNINFKNWQYVEAKIPYDVTPKAFKNIYVVETNPNRAYEGQVLIDGLTITYGLRAPNIVKKSSAKPSKDIMNKESELKQEGFTFGVTKIQDNIDDLTGTDASQLLKENMNTKQVGVFMNQLDSNIIKDLDTNLIINSASPFYLARHYNNVLFLNINTSKGGINAQDAEQWKHINKSLENSPSDHIIAVMPTKVFGDKGFDDEKEAQVFHDIMLEQVDKGKTVWVIQGSDKTQVNLKEGVRYMEYDQKDIENKDDLNTFNIIEFVVNGKDISYQIKNLFK